MTAGNRARRSRNRVAAATCVVVWTTVGYALAQADPTPEPPSAADADSATRPPETVAPPNAIAPATDNRGASAIPSIVQPVTSDLGNTGAAAAAPAPGPSLDERKQQLDDTINGLSEIPETPAAFAIGIGTDQVAHPGDLRDAAAHLTTLLGPGGKIIPGVAIEVAPFRALYAKQTLEEWQRRASFGQRLIDSVRLSIATAADPSARGISNAPPLIAAGLRLSLINDRDYRNNAAFIDAVRQALTKCFPEIVAATGSGGSNFTEVKLAPDCADLDSLLAAMKDEYLRKGHRLELASAIVVADQGVTEGADFRATQVWAAYEYSFGAPAVGAAAQVTHRDTAAGKGVNDLRFGARLNVATGQLSWSLSGAYARLQTERNALDFGGSLTVRLGSWGIVRGSVQGERDFGARVTDVTGLATIATATDDVLFSKGFDYKSSPH